PRLALGLVLLALAAAGCKADRPTSTTAATPASSEVGAPDGLPQAPPAPDTPGASDGAQPTAPAPAESAPLPSASQLARMGRDAYYGLYLMGRKVGHAHVWDRAAKDGEAGGFVVGFQMNMSVEGGGRKNELDASELRFYAKEPPHALISSRFSSSAMGFRDERRAEPMVLDGKPVLRIFRSVDGAKEDHRDVAPTEDTLGAQLEVSPTSLDGLEVGTSKKVKLFSWEREADELVSVTVSSRGKRMVAGLEGDIATLVVRYETSGLEGKSVLSADGSMLEMTLGPGLLLKLEEREVAMSGVVGLDILGTGMVSPTKLGSPHAIDRLELTLTGDAAVKLPTSPNQAVETTVDGEVATHKVTLSRGPGAPVLEAELADALAADATIDSTHPAIAAKAKELVDGITTPREKVEAIAAWVHATLDKRLATHLPTASTVLDKKVGDCTEHTWLTVAMLRALEIPSRPVYGVGYTGDGEGVFAYHAWVEVALDGRWEMIDPTWGQKSADATHLRMGSSLGEVAASMGGLTIQSAVVPGR
ncbi:MAG TPA: transglutaminase domain-containing protein, partial [Myxococcota bacterium]|nr:transglutaminase domain-containing protein [Myxococcota bacterium]